MLRSDHPSPDPADPVPSALREERAHHERCRAALTVMARGAEEHVVTGEDVSASGADAEVLGRALRTRARRFRELPEGPLFFGRLDFASAAPGGGSEGEAEVEGGERAAHAGQSYHIGRVRITEDPTAPPLVVDWRAPVSRAFYQAAPHDPRGVAVRRRFGWTPGGRGAPEDLTALEDEHLAEPPSGHPDAGAPGGLLAAEIRRPRTGPMRDIVATIQPDQDDLVRADPADSLCVQGAPGTGKTAVGLHRAAYLLYAHPQRVRRSGLLVIGPHRTFLRYIAQVLPALGEDGIGQLTVADLLARQPVRARDGAATARLKHDPRMARVLRRALYAAVRPAAVADAGLTVPDGSYRWRLSADELRALVADVLAERPPYATGRERVAARAVARLRERAERRAGPRTEGWARRLERSRPLTAFLDAVWPKAVPEEVLAGLLSGSPALDRAAHGVLDADERAALRWDRPPRSYRTARWSAADLVLLDELAGLVGPPEGFGHIVVDEAQDLSPMECRAIARRAPHGSLTVLGDLAQATTPWAARSWAELLGHLGRPGARRVALSTGFRVPGAVADLANRLLDTLGLPAADVPRIRSLRADGTLTVRRVPDTAAATVTAVRAALAAAPGSLAVIAADAEVPRLRTALTAAGLDADDPTDATAASGGSGDPGVTLLPATLAKGLEFDHVIVVEPAAVQEAEPRGAHRLYVVLTRAVTHLEILHRRPLPFD
ncbi:ATP-binding domain-containing protein [Streptomyces sp. NPDC005955]|uniref:HelD family protein n=1 Tax=Streptomyces sp. NPDC005955 TaxID=3364738 RepID=UPI0036A8A2D2